ncbi:DUF2079 domain-containing protein, partial [Patescibacteria group bacterium]|nr:DUF2079 domain-containing protein [Patescibacteria group bacterium]
NQVFSNSADGNLFDFTIHPHTYLGDHLALALVIILPFYWLWQSPLCLLVIQAVLIGLAAWPLFLIARKFLQPSWSFLVALIFLLSPLTHSINLFEWHLISLALPILFLCFYFFLNNKFWPWLGLCSLLLPIREDLALVLLAFFFLGLVEKRKLKWVLTPLIMSLAWLGLSYFLTTYFSGYPSYKFLAYFSWLGTEPWEMIKNFFIHPVITLTHIFSWQNFSLLLGLFLPFLFIPFHRPKYLILSLPYYIIFILAGFEKVVILNSHYLVFLTFGIWLSFIAGLRKIQTAKTGFWLIIGKEKAGLIVILLAATIYSAVTLGPLYTTAKTIINGSDQKAKEIRQQLMDQIPAQASLLTSYNTITNLSSRKNLYLNRYFFLDQKQYRQESFPLPADLDYAYLDSRDFLVYQLQYGKRPSYQEGWLRISDLLTSYDLHPIDFQDSFILFAKDHTEKQLPYQLLDISQSIKNDQEVLIDDRIIILNYQLEPVVDRILPISFYWQARQEIEQDYQLLVTYLDQDQQVVGEKLYAMNYGLLPTTDWSTDQVVVSNHLWLLPDRKDLSALKINLVTFTGYFGPSDLLGGEIKNLEVTKLEPALTIPL